MEQFCAENDITIVHGSPRTSTTQGLVERHNRATKMTPYEACYGLKPHRETTSNPDSNTPPRGTITGARTNTESHTA